MSQFHFAHKAIFKPKSPDKFWKAFATIDNGFTLVELLIVAVLISVGVAAAARVIISQISMERTLVGAQTTDGLRSRISFLIESDIAEGRDIIASQSQTGCPAQADQVFAVLVPFLSGTAVVDSVVIYANSAGNLIRCGPPIQRNGSLNLSASPSPTTVAEGVQISNVAINSTNTSVSFTLNFPAFGASPATSFPAAYGTKSFRVGS